VVIVIAILGFAFGWCCGRMYGLDDLARTEQQRDDFKAWGNRQARRLDRLEQAFPVAKFMNEMELEPHDYQE